MFLRPYRPGDFDTLYALDVACFPVPFRFTRAMMRRVVLAPSACVLLACEPLGDREEDVLGFCAAEMGGVGATKTAYLATLDVRPVDQGRGIGRQLMRALERQLTAAGVEQLQLHVFAGNGAALYLYRSLGYEEQGREQDFYGRGLHAFLYGKSLGAAAEELPKQGAPEQG